MGHLNSENEVGVHEDKVKYERIFHKRIDVDMCEGLQHARLDIIWYE